LTPPVAEARWYVLKAVEGDDPEAPKGYLGTRWDTNGNGGPVNPRKTTTPDLQLADLWPDRVDPKIPDRRLAPRDEARRASAILGVEFRLIPVVIAGRGKDAVIRLAGLPLSTTPPSQRTIGQVAATASVSQRRGK
jgi:hypothetical protein